MSTLARLCGAPATEERTVSFEVECDDFAVPEWPGLRCSATYEVYGHVAIDHSGDDTTPDGPPTPRVCLLDVRAYEIHLVEDDLDIQLPKWLEERLAIGDASEMDAAFLQAVGGQSALDEQAVEIACGC